jgi:hypothetical protein
MSLGFKGSSTFPLQSTLSDRITPFIHFRHYHLKIVDIVLLIGIYENQTNLSIQIWDYFCCFLDAVQFVFLGLSNVYAGNQLALLDVDGVVFRFLAFLRTSTAE